MSKHDLILSGGTVLDPVNGMEAIADVGISGGAIDGRPYSMTLTR